MLWGHGSEPDGGLGWAEWEPARWMRQKDDMRFMLVTQVSHSLATGKGLASPSQQGVGEGN